MLLSLTEAHVQYQHIPSILCEAKRVFQVTARKCVNEFWLKTSASIQAAADTKSEYEGIRKTVGTKKKS